MEAVTFLLAPPLVLQNSGAGAAALVWKATKSDWLFVFFFCVFLGETASTGCGHREKQHTGSVPSAADL